MINKHLLEVDDDDDEEEDQDFDTAEDIKNAIMCPTHILSPIPVSVVKLENRKLINTSTTITTVINEFCSS